MNEIFGRNGTMTGALDVANTISGMKSNSAKDRLSSLVSLIMSIFG